jgi:hypothetical protein
MDADLSATGQGPGGGHDRLGGTPVRDLHVHARHVMQPALRGAHRHLGAADAHDFSRLAARR